MEKRPSQHSPMKRSFVQAQSQARQTLSTVLSREYMSRQQTDLATTKLHLMYCYGLSSETKCLSPR